MGSYQARKTRQDARQEQFRFTKPKQVFVPEYDEEESDYNESNQEQWSHTSEGAYSM